MSVDGATGQHGRDDDVVVRKADRGWVVGGENVSDLTSAIVLADLLAADLAPNDDAAVLEAVDRNDGSRPERPDGSQHAAPRHDAARQRDGRRGTPGRHAARPSGNDGAEADEASRLAVTVAQLEHALASRVGVEQAIGVLAERHRLRPREAFDLLRGAARSRGQRIPDIAQDVVASTANPLLRLPDELARKLPDQRPRGRSLRRGPKPAEQF
ncbi:MAG: ANTAR domain-containing protein [Trebonia sp.]|uniref:ANTAR domain-containing protein n=2 Tax=Trebonia sp. TaxID=2767075 RepID=UPI003BAF2F46